MAKPAATKQVRALFRDEAGEVVTSLFVERPAPDAMTLLHDYSPADFAPRPGWTVEGRGFRLQITGVTGRALKCVPVEG